MVGVLASSKTLKGIPNKYPNRYPDPKTFSSIFQADRRALNLIHYATDDRSTLRGQVGKLVELGGPYLDGFQFNIPWPSPSAIHRPGLRTILQIGSRALEECANDPQRVCDKLTYYDPEVTDVLIDASGGRGIPINAETAASYVEAISERIPRLGIGIAGGLSAESLGIIAPLLKRFPQTSIDAEGCLRTAEDHLDIARMTSYLASAISITSNL